MLSNILTTRYSDDTISCKFFDNIYTIIRKDVFPMKKVIAILFAVIFALSCMAVMAGAEDFDGSFCPACQTYCGTTERLSIHLETCSKYKASLVDLTNNTCYWCGKSMSESALNTHYDTYVHAKNHIKSCPFSGEDYIDGGCNCTFSRTDAYERHVAGCPWEGQYSVTGYKHLLLGLVKDFAIGIFKNANWGDVLTGLKGLVAGVDLGALKDIFNAGMGSLDVDFRI